ncbi:unnamed protein product [Somion occarium]|uniref:Uncharacterized protein n=1 Tax=Somion occarium TaxID=3059160 RepID=A0ABP1DDT4_9APHY
MEEIQSNLDMDLDSALLNFNNSNPLPICHLLPELGTHIFLDFVQDCYLHRYNKGGRTYNGDILYGLYEWPRITLFAATGWRTAFANL